MCDEPDELDEMQFEDAPPVPKVTVPVTPERSFFAALRALRHLYFKLETDNLELHSACEVCDEIRNFLSVPHYRADDFDAAYLTARTALKHLYSKVSGEGMKLHSENCGGCNEVKAFVADHDYRGNFDDPLGTEMHRPLNYAPLGWVDERFAKALNDHGRRT
jgi:hypothetical protein